MKIYLERVVVGFQYGIGLFIALYIIEFLLSFSNSSLKHPDAYELEELQSAFVFRHSSIVNNRTFVSILENNSGYLLSSYKVTAIVYGDSQEIVGVCDKAFHEDIPDGEAKFVEVQCSIKSGRNWKYVKSEITDIFAISSGFYKYLF